MIAHRKPPKASVVPQSIAFAIALASSVLCALCARPCSAEDEVAYRASSFGLFGTELDAAFATDAPLISFSIPGTDRYMLAGMQGSGGLSLDGSSSASPFHFGFADTSGKRGWFVEGSFSRQTATDSSAYNSTSIPDGASHSVTVGSDTHTWADTVNSLYYQEGEASLTNIGLDAGWKIGLWTVGLQAAYEAGRGDLDSALSWLEANRDEWTEIFYNDAADGALPVSVLDHIELTERRYPCTDDVVKLELPASYGPQSMGLSLGYSSSDRSSSVVKQCYYPATTTSTYSFQTSSDVVEDAARTISAGARYAYTFRRGAASLKLGGSAYADYAPAVDVSELSILQGYIHSTTGGTGKTYASTRSETENHEYEATSLSWGAFAHARAQAPLRAKLFSLAAAAEARIGFENLSGLIDIPTAYSNVTRADNDGDADFNEASDTITVRSLSLSTNTAARSYVVSSRIALPLAIDVPLPLEGKGRRSDAKVEFFASIEPSVEYDISIDRSGSVSESYLVTTTTGTGTLSSSTTTESGVVTGSDETDGELTISAQWLGGLLFRLRGNAVVFITASGDSDSGDVALSMRTVVPLP